MKSLYSTCLSLIFILSYVYGCSQPRRWRSHGLLWRAKKAEIVAFATVMWSPSASLIPEKTGLYSAKFRVHCVFKGPPINRIVTVSGFGHEEGLCTRSSAFLHRPYIVFLTKRKYANSDVYTVNEVNVQTASTEANKKHLRKLVRIYEPQARAPIDTSKTKNEISKCPPLYELIDILRQARLQARNGLNAVPNSVNQTSVLDKKNSSPHSIEKNENKANDVKDIGSKEKSNVVEHSKENHVANDEQGASKQKVKVMRLSSKWPSSSASRPFASLTWCFLVWTSFGLLTLTI